MIIAFALAAALQTAGDGRHGVPDLHHRRAFGIREGLPISQLRIIERGDDGVHIITPPEQNRLFKSYAVQAAPGVGVCMVMALGLSIPDDRSGGVAKARMRSLIEALTVRYGPPTRYWDYIQPTALWDGPLEWAASIRQEERTYGAEWRRSETDVLEVEVKANSLSDTRVDVTYVFPNITQCDRHKDTVDARGL